MIKFIAFAFFALALATSAQAMSPPPLHRSDGISTEARYVGRGVARGHRYGVARSYGHRRYGYRHYGYNYGYRHYGYRSYGYRPYGHGVARGIARRNIRRGVRR